MLHTIHRAPEEDRRGTRWRQLQEEGQEGRRGGILEMLQHAQQTAAGTPLLSLLSAWWFRVPMQSDILPWNGYGKGHGRL